jgi:hypothetical protein
LIPKNAVEDRTLVVAWLYERQRVGKSDVLQGQHHRSSRDGATEGLRYTQPDRAAWHLTQTARRAKDPCPSLPVAAVDFFDHLEAPRIPSVDFMTATIN